MSFLHKLQKRKGNEKREEKIDLDEISDSDDIFEAMKRRIQLKIQQDDDKNAWSENDIYESQQFRINDMIASDEDDMNKEEEERELRQPLLPKPKYNYNDDECEEENDSDLFVSSDSYLKHRYHSSSDELPLDEIGKYESPLTHYRLNAAKIVSKIKIPKTENELNRLQINDHYQLSQLQINDIIETDTDNVDIEQKLIFQQNEGVNDNENDENLYNIKQSETLMGFAKYEEIAIENKEDENKLIMGINGCEQEIYSDNEDDDDDGGIVGMSVTLMGHTKNDESDCKEGNDNNDNLIVGVTLMGYTKNEDDMDFDEMNIDNVNNKIDKENNVESISDMESNDELIQNGSVTLLGVCGDNEKVIQ